MTQHCPLSAPGEFGETVASGGPAWASLILGAPRTVAARTSKAGLR